MQLEGRDEHAPLSSEEFNDIMNTIDIGGADHIAVAVSGGGDSMALAILLKEWCGQKGIKLSALTVDHGLREASKREVLRVEDWLNKRSIDCEILTWAGSKPQSNIQDEARTERYRLLGDWCSENGVENLFLAHHKDDQAETFLMRLIRGSGVDGLAAMDVTNELHRLHSASDSGGLKLHRPLLDVPKVRLMALLKKEDVEWIDDPSNEDEKYLRVQVRNLFKNIKIDGFNVERLSSTAKRMRRVRSLLEDLTLRAESDYVDYNPLGFAALNPAFANVLHEEISLRLLSKILKKISGNQYPPRHGKLETLFDKLKKGEFVAQTLLGTILFLSGDENIIVAREASAINEKINISDMEQLLWDNRFLIDVTGREGFISPIKAPYLKAIYNNPEFKERLTGIFESAHFRDRIMPSLPCIVTENGEIYLPDMLLQLVGMTDLGGFSAIFKE